jgi:hypothetical protein
MNQDDGKVISHLVDCLCVLLGGTAVFLVVELVRFLAGG